MDIDSPARQPAELTDPLTRTLVTRARTGDGRAYARLVALAEPRLRLYVRVRSGEKLRSREETDDIVQETWSEAHRSLHAFEDRGRGSFVRWLCRVAENVMRGLIDRHDAAKRGSRTPAVALDTSTDRPESATGVSTGVSKREERERVAVALEKLPSQDRNLLTLRFWADFTIDEVAEAMALPPTTIRRRLTTAATALGTLLEEPS